MFDFAGSPFRVAEDFADVAVRRSHLAAPEATWDAAEGVEIAGEAWTARAGHLWAVPPTRGRPLTSPPCSAEEAAVAACGAAAAFELLNRAVGLSVGRAARERAAATIAALEMESSRTRTCEPRRRSSRRNDSGARR